MSSTLLAGVPNLLNAQSLISTFGLIGIAVIVFAESGLFVGFFLPGDSLLFTAGLLVANHQYLHSPLWLVCLVAVVAAIAGDQVGYAFGRRTGPALFRRPNSRLFKQQYLHRATAFFERHGARSILLARLVPIVRTFTPIVAGAAGMRYRTFLIFNAIGGFAWGVGVTVLGFFLGQIAVIRSNIDVILVVVVVISVLPIGVGLLRNRLRHRPTRTPVPAERSADQARSSRG